MFTTVVLLTCLTLAWFPLVGLATSAASWLDSLSSPSSLNSAAATATLTDDAGGTSLFPGGTLFSPGTTRSACIVLAAPGSAAGDTVTIDATGITGTLAPWLNVTIAIGSGGSFGDCTGFTGTTVYSSTLTGLAAAAATGGVPTGWLPAQQGARSFRFAVSLSAQAPLSTMDRTTQAAFRWRLVTPDTPPPAPEPSVSPSVAPEPQQTDPPPAEPTESPAVQEPVTDVDGTVTPTTVPSPTPSEPTRSPVPASAPAWPDGRIGGGDGNDAGPAEADRPLRITQPVPELVVDTMASVLREPQIPVTSLLVAGLFLLVQNLIDSRDPKLAAASRTSRELTLEFPRSYQRTAE